MVNDIFGVKQIYPTTEGGNEWFLDDAPEMDGQLISEEVTIQNATGYFRVTNPPTPEFLISVTSASGIPTTDCDLDHSELADRGYRSSQDDWRNHEQTVFLYFQDVSDSVDFQILRGRSNARTDTEADDCCERVRYNLRIYHAESGSDAGKVQFSKHVAGVVSLCPEVVQTVVPNFYRRWVGHKFIIYNLAGTNQVRLEHWICPSDSATDKANGWTKVNTFTDTGSNLGSSSAVCGGTARQAITWGNVSAGILYEGDELRFKDWSVGEIDYQGTFGGGGGSGGGGDPGTGNCGSTDTLGIKWMVGSGEQTVIEQSRDDSNDYRWSQNYQNILPGYEATVIGTFDGVASGGHMALKHWGPNHSGDCGYTEGGDCCCITAGHKVSTSEGLIPIEQIKEGDLVLTHKGRYKKVVRLYEHYYNRDLYTIKTYGTSNYGEVTATHTHQFLTKDRGWVRAEDLTTKDWLMIPINKTVNDFKNVCIGSIRHINGKYTLQNLKLEKDLLTVIGYYLAEGNASKYHSTDEEYRDIMFTFSSSENDKPYIEELIMSLRNLGFSVRTHHRPQYNVMMVICYSKILANWITQEFGHGAKNKRLPQWLIELPNEKTEIVFEKYMNGDGYKVSKGLHNSRHVKSISENLLIGMRDIALRLGYKTSMRKQKIVDGQESTILGRKVKINTPYELYVTKVSEQEYTDKNKSRLARRKTYPYKFNSKIRLDENYQYNRIRSIDKNLDFDGMVYDFEVEDDHSFTVSSILCLNCWYDTGIRANGDIQTQIERPHPSNSDWSCPECTMSNIGKGMDGNSIGLKWLVYPLQAGGNVDVGGMKLKMWVDTDPLNAQNRPNNNWVLVYDITDNPTRDILADYDAPDEQEIELRVSDTDTADFYGGGVHVRRLRRPEDLVPCVPGGGGGGGGGTEPPVCPTGYHWDATRQLCVADGGGGGNPDPPVPETLYNDFKIVYNILSDSDGCICNPAPYTPPPPPPPPPECPPGQHWDPVQLACVDDSVPPPPPPPPGDALYNVPYTGGTEVKIGMKSGDSARYLQIGIWIRGSQSDILGTVVKRGEIGLKKVGAPTGLAYVRIRNGDTDAIETELGTIDCDEVGSTPQYYAAENLSATYTVAEDDRLMIEYGGGDADNYLVGYTQSNIEGNDTKVTRRSNTQSEGSYSDTTKEFASKWFA